MQKFNTNCSHNINLTAKEVAYPAYTAKKWYDSNG